MTGERDGLAQVFGENAQLQQWYVVQIGSGRVTLPKGDDPRLELHISPGAGYHDAQISDYNYTAWNFRWTPPVRMTVTAYASASGDRLRGTAGFGFWNHPLSPDTRRLPRLPAAIWFFFGAPPHDFRVALDMPGYGWKAQTIDAANRGALALAPAALPLMLLMRVPALYRPLYRRIQHLLKVGEAVLPADLLATRHTYTLEWKTRSSRFFVDGVLVHESPFAPSSRAPLGFIAWIDNQYLIATPQGRFRWGIAEMESAQSLVLDEIRLERM